MGLGFWAGYARQFDRDQVQQVRADEVVVLATLESQAASWTVLTQRREAREDARRGDSLHEAPDDQLMERLRRRGEQLR